LPTALSDTPDLFRKNSIPLDLALISVCPADKHGYFSLGPSADVTRAAVESASVVFAQINTNLPRTFGDTLIHNSEINHFISQNEALPIHEKPAISKEDRKIAEIIAELIPNGATIQAGIGRIPMAVMEKLIHHKDLGIHTEVLTDAFLPLLEKGVVTNRYKSYERGFSVCAFAIGTKTLFDEIDDNPAFRFFRVHENE